MRNSEVSDYCKTHSRQTLHTSQATSERVQHQRVSYWQQIREVNPQDLVFIDETGTNLAMTRNYARVLGGQRAYGIRPYYPGKNITLIGAMSASGFLGSMTIEGGKAW